MQSITLSPTKRKRLLAILVVVGIVCISFGAIYLMLKPAAFYGFRASAHFFLNQKQDALEDLDKAISLAPENAGLYVNRGSLFGTLGQYQKAIDDYSKAINLNPKEGLAYCGRGIAYGGLRQYQKAVDDLNKAISLDPERAKLYLCRGYAYGQLGQYQKAIDDYSKAINLSPTTPRSFLRRLGKISNRGVSHNWLEQYQVVIYDCIWDIADSRFGNAYYHCVRAEAYEKIGRTDLAAKDKEMAAKLGYKPEQK